MKKIIKNNLFGFILGIVLTMGIGVAASTIFASSIKYEPEWKKSNGDNITNVSEAIDVLYEKSNLKVNGIGENIVVSNYTGTRDLISTKLKLKEGTYLCNSTYSNATTESSTSFFGNSTQTNIVSDCDNYIEINNFHKCQSADATNRDIIETICMLGKTFICKINNEKEINFSYGITGIRNDLPVGFEASCTMINIE